MCSCLHTSWSEISCCISLICREFFYRSSSTSFIVSLCCRYSCLGQFIPMWTFSFVFKVCFQNVACHHFPLLGSGLCCKVVWVSVCNLGSSKVKHFFFNCAPTVVSSNVQELKYTALMHKTKLDRDWKNYFSTLQLDKH